MDIEVYIYKAATRDLYIDFQWVDNSSAYIEAKTIPLMNVLWTGFGLLAVGIVLRTIAWRNEPKDEPDIRRPRKPEAKAKDEARAPEPSAPKEPKDYEALVEEELRKYKEKRSS
jgi:hypothetical protein